MKFLLIILFSAVILIAKTDDYILEFQAKVKNLRVFDISKSEQFRSYDLEGTFTDNFGNYGKSSVIVISDIRDGKLLRLDATSENIYSNNEKLYMRGVREKSDVDAGIAYNIVIGASKNFIPLIGMKCTTSVRYFDDAIFGIQKCNIKEEMKKVLRIPNK
jgi:hypothetical protein